MRTKKAKHPKYPPKRDPKPPTTNDIVWLEHRARTGRLYVQQGTVVAGMTLHTVPYVIIKVRSTFLECPHICMIPIRKKVWLCHDFQLPKTLYQIRCATSTAEKSGI